MGRLSAGERQLLLEGPINDYWREKIGIDQLYPDLSEERKREEVAADVYAGQLLGYSPRREAWPVHDEPGPSGGAAGSLLGRVRHFVGRHPEELKPAAAEAASLYSLIASGDYLERGILDPVFAVGIAATSVGIGPDHPHRETIFRSPSSEPVQKRRGGVRCGGFCRIQSGSDNRNHPVRVRRRGRAGRIR